MLCCFGNRLSSDVARSFREESGTSGGRGANNRGRHVAGVSDTEFQTFCSQVGYSSRSDKKYLKKALKDQRIEWSSAKEIWGKVDFEFKEDKTNDVKGRHDQFNKNFREIVENQQCSGIYVRRDGTIESTEVNIDDDHSCQKKCSAKTEERKNTSPKFKRRLTQYLGHASRETTIEKRTIAESKKQHPDTPYPVRSKKTAMNRDLNSAYYLVEKKAPVFIKHHQANARGALRCIMEVIQWDMDDLNKLVSFPRRSYYLHWIYKSVAELELPMEDASKYWRDCQCNPIGFHILIHDVVKCRVQSSVGSSETKLSLEELATINTVFHFSGNDVVELVKKIDVENLAPLVACIKANAGYISDEFKAPRIKKELAKMTSFLLDCSKEKLSSYVRNEQVMKSDYELWNSDLSSLASIRPPSRYSQHNSRRASMREREDSQVPFGTPEQQSQGSQPSRQVHRDTVAQQPSDQIQYGATGQYFFE